MSNASEIKNGNQNPEAERKVAKTIINDEIIPLRDRKKTDTGTPRVSICCLAFNHEPFIRDTLEGFLDQCTTFPVEILIHDDASTDQTADIIRHYTNQYPHLIKPIFQTVNKYSAGIKVDSYNTDRAAGKYLAFCEGDDYWTDPLKLQKQYRFLEEHGDHVACFGNYTRYHVLTGERSDSDIRSGDSADKNGFTFSLEEMKNGWLTKTLTAMVRRTVADNIDPSVYSNYRDIHFFYHVMKQGRAYLFYDNFGVYQVHPGGINSMKQGSVNANAAYQCYRELYLQNKDEFSRYMCFRSTAGFFNYNIFSTRLNYNLKLKLSLFFEMVYVCSNPKEIVIIFNSFIKQSLKDKLKFFKL